MTENQEVKIIDPANRLKEAFGSPLFLALAVLVSVVTGSGVLFGSLNIFYILTTIGVWLVYASARSEKALSSTGLAMISGTAKAAKIVMLVISILIIVAAIVIVGIFSAIIPSVIGEEMIVTIPEFKDALYEAFEENGIVISVNGSYIEGIFDVLEEEIGTAEFPVLEFLISIIIGITFGLLFVGVAMLVLSLTFYRTLHKFHRSVCENAKRGADIQKARSLKVWLMVFGIFAGIGALSSFGMMSAISALASAGVFIVGSVWVNQYFCSAKKTEE